MALALVVDIATNPAVERAHPDAWLSEVGPANAIEAVHHGAHYNAFHIPDPKDDPEHVDPTTYKDDLHKLVRIAREWLVDYGLDPDRLG